MALAFLSLYWYYWPLKLSKIPEPPESDYAHAAKIAKALVAPLQSVEASLPDWEVCLQQRTCEPEAFLTQTEKALMEALRAPELAGMRDWVREEFRQSASTIQFYRSISGPTNSGEIADAFDRGWSHGRERRVSRGAFQNASETGRIFAARLPLAEAQRPSHSAVLAQFSWDKFFREQVVPGAFAHVAQVVRRTRELSEGNDLITNLCVRSNPVGAQFVLWPSSEPVRKVSGISIGTLVIYRGLYAYDITMRKVNFRCNPRPGDPTRCSKIDLVNDGRPVFHCADVDDLEAEWDWQCSRGEGPLDGCTTRP